MKKQETWIIKDWAGNTLRDGFHCPLEFKTFDDAWMYIYETFAEEDFEDLFAEQRSFSVAEEY